MSENKNGAEEKKAKQFMMVHKSFQNNLIALKSFVETFNPIAVEKDSTLAQQIQQVLESAFKAVNIDITKHIEESKNQDPDERPKLKLEKEQAQVFLTAIKPISKISALPMQNTKLLSQSSFVLLIGYFEYLFADLLRFYYKYYPGQISDKPITVAINELKTYETVEDAIEYLINKEVESLLFDLSFQELITFFSKTLKINIEERFVNWDIINEARERRHIIVHNNSIINKKYLAKSKTENLPDKEELIIGNQIQIPQIYFITIFNSIFIAGEILVFKCWNQWLKNSDSNMNFEILDTTFTCLKQNLYNAAEDISLFSTGIQPQTDEDADILLRCKFNYFIALKLQKKQTELDKALSDVKISVLSPLFKVAYFALRDDKVNVLQNLRNSKIVDKFKEEYLHEWPLFQELREDAEFMEKAIGELSAPN